MTTLVHSRVVRSGQERTATTGRSSVPWSAVVTFAIALALADWFWVMSMRGATGAIERTQAPFVDWLRESALVLPLYMLAVLGAFTIAKRRFGPVVRTPRTVVATAMMVVTAATLVAVLGLAASSAYDYFLQANQLNMMDSMKSMCGGDCTSLERATLRLQERSVGYGSVFVLATNLVVVGWIVAIRGGRITLSKARKESAEGSTAERTRTSRLEDVRVFLAAGLVGSAVIHAAVVPEHLQEWTAAGIFFVVLTAAQLAVAIQVVAKPRRLVVLGAAAISVLPLLLWAVSRTVGLPFGPESGVAESIGLADGAAGALEIGTLVAAVVLLRKAGSLGRRTAVSAHVNWLVLLAVVAVMVVGLGGTDLPLFNLTVDVATMAHN
jgi:hypothetical protein